jgi:sec-independent protein translocase protein TatC
MPKTEERPEETRMSVGEHLEELRRRILYALLGLVAGMVVGLIFAPDIIGMLKEPYIRGMEKLGLKGDLVVLQATSGLTNYLKVAFYSGLVLGSPWIFYQLWMFVAAGLHDRERRYVRWAVPFCTLLFLGGAAFFLWVVSERILHYLLKLTVWLGMDPMITFENHISFMLRMMVVFGLAFQTPLVILVLVWTGLVDMKTLRRYRRHVIIAIMIFSAMFTPPDAFSMAALAVPMWLLYELGILLAYLLLRKEKPPQN